MHKAILQFFSCNFKKRHVQLLFIRIGARKPSGLKTFGANTPVLYLWSARAWPRLHSILYPARPLAAVRPSAYIADQVLYASYWFTEIPWMTMQILDTPE